jgi:hypothetical protein
MPAIRTVSIYPYQYLLCPFFNRGTPAVQMIMQCPHNSQTLARVARKSTRKKLGLQTR